MRSSENDVVVNTIFLRLLDLSRQPPRALEKLAQLLRQLPPLLRWKLRPQARQPRCCSGLARRALVVLFDRGVIRPRNPHDRRRSRPGCDSPTAKVCALKCACNDLRSEQIPPNRKPDPWPNAGLRVRIYTKP